MRRGWVYCQAVGDTIALSWLPGHSDGNDPEPHAVTDTPGDVPADPEPTPHAVTDTPGDTYSEPDPDPDAHPDADFHPDARSHPDAESDGTEPYAINRTPGDAVPDLARLA